MAHVHGVVTKCNYQDETHDASHSPPARRGLVDCAVGAVAHEVSTCLQRGSRPAASRGDDCRPLATTSDSGTAKTQQIARRRCSRQFRNGLNRRDDDRRTPSSWQQQARLRRNPEVTHKLHCTLEAWQMRGCQVSFLLRSSYRLASGCERSSPCTFRGLLVHMQPTRLGTLKT